MSAGQSSDEEGLAVVGRSAPRDQSTCSDRAQGGTSTICAEGEDQDLALNDNDDLAHAWRQGVDGGQGAHGGFGGHVLPTRCA